METIIGYVLLSLVSPLLLGIMSGADGGEFIEGFMGGIIIDFFFALIIVGFTLILK